MYWGLRSNVFGMKYCFCLCLYSSGRCVRRRVSGPRLVSLCGEGPGLVSMSPLRAMSAVLFHI